MSTSARNSDPAVPVLVAAPKRAAHHLSCAAFAAAAARGRQVDLFLNDPRHSLSKPSAPTSNPLDIPLGKVPLLPQPPRPVTPARLPRPRVFIRQPPRPASLDIDIPAVLSPTNPHLTAGERALITRPPSTPSSTNTLSTIGPDQGITPFTNLYQHFPSPSLEQFKHRVRPINPSCLPKLPPPPPPPKPSRRLSTDARFYFSDDDVDDHDQRKVSSAGRVRSLHLLHSHCASSFAATVDAPSLAPLSLNPTRSVTPASAPPSTHRLTPRVDAAALLNVRHLVVGPDRPRIAAGTTNVARERLLAAQAQIRVVNGTDSADALSRVRRAVSALRSLSFQNGCEDDLDTAWGQVTAPCDAAVKKMDDGENGANNGGCGNNGTTENGVEMKSSGVKIWRRPYGRVSSNGACEMKGSGEIEAFDVDVNKGHVGDEKVCESEIGMSRGSEIGVDLKLSVRRASERLVRDLDAVDDDGDKVWQNNGERGDQKRGRLSAVYAAAPWIRQCRRSDDHGRRDVVDRYGMKYGDNDNAKKRACKQYRHREHIAHGQSGVRQRRSLWSNAVICKDKGCNSSSDSGHGVNVCGCGKHDACETKEAENARRLLLTGNGHSLLAACSGHDNESKWTNVISKKQGCSSALMRNDKMSKQSNGPPVSSDVDKYVEFIHASASREVRAKRAFIRSKVVHRAQAVFRRRRK